MTNEYTEEDVVNRVYEEIAAGNKTKAKTIMALCTNLRIKERKAIIEGQAELTPDQITNTDLDNLNKFGCTVGSTSLLLLSGILFWLILR